ncbi:TetR family transcriptional regulator [Pseudonocardia kongjuensis]|uniref:TetR family transcriptional regulator n=1 Tax=Pseudonocardia kongjuensis TaxID=102227 RepID=A0ABN1XUI7_9PSEU
MVNRFHDTAHRQMRDGILDAAAAEAVARGWKGLQMQSVAAASGVSRQTLYNTFTNKHGLAQALVLRLTEQFLDGVEQALNSHVEIYDQWVAAIRYTLDAAAADPLLKAVLTADGSDELLPLLTSEAGPVIRAARNRLSAVLRATRPDLNHDDITVATEAAARLAISHIVLPLHPTEQAAEQIAQLVDRFLAPDTRDSSPKAS